MKKTNYLEKIVGIQKNTTTNELFFTIIPTLIYTNQAAVKLSDLHSQHIKMAMLVKVVFLYNLVVG